MMALVSLGHHANGWMWLEEELLNHVELSRGMLCKFSLPKDDAQNNTNDTPSDASFLVFTSTEVYVKEYCRASDDEPTAA